MNKITDFCYAYNYLKNNPITFMYGLKLFCAFEKCLFQEVYKINPKTNRRDIDSNKNTKTKISLDFGPYKEFEDIWIPVIDEEFHTEADTYEEAIIILANKVKEKFDYNFEI